MSNEPSTRFTSTPYLIGPFNGDAASSSYSSFPDLNLRFLNATVATSLNALQISRSQAPLPFLISLSMYAVLSISTTASMGTVLGRNGLLYFAPLRAFSGFCLRPQGFSRTFGSPQQTARSIAWKNRCSRTVGGW